MLQEIIVNQADMAKALSTVMHAVSSRPIKQIYTGVHVTARSGRLVLTATDGELTIRTDMDADTGVEGSTVYPARLISDLIQRSSGLCDIHIAVDDKNSAKIVSGGSKTNMVCMSVEDFPEIADIENGHTYTMPANALKTAVQRVLFAVSTDESRKVLTGVLTEIYANEACFVTIDGYRLAKATAKADNSIPDGKESVSAVIPGRFMRELVKLIPDDETPVELSLNSSRVSATVRNIRMYTSLLTGEFIDYKHIIPDGAGTETEVSTEVFNNALERCALMAREAKSNLITIDVSAPDGMTMYSRAERGDVHEAVDAYVNGNGVKISFNAQYIAEAAKNVDTDRMRIFFNGSLAPCMIKPENGDEFVYIVLPVRTA